MLVKSALMGNTFRYFLIEDDDTIVPVPMSRFEGIFTGLCSTSRYAGKQMRVAEFVVELAERIPTGAYHASFYILHFDLGGKVDQEQLLDQAQAALDAKISQVLEKSEPEAAKEFIRASSKFARRRIHEPYDWTPDYQMQERLVELALGRASAKK